MGGTSHRTGTSALCDHPVEWLTLSLSSITIYRAIVLLSEPVGAVAVNNSQHENRPEGRRFRWPGRRQPRLSVVRDDPPTVGRTSLTGEALNKEAKAA